MEPIATKTQVQQQRRLEFIERLPSDVPVPPVTLAIARLAGRIEGQQEAMGIQFAFEDLLIGATALHLSYQVATLNLRDFRENPRSFRGPTLNYWQSLGSRRRQGASPLRGLPTVALKQHCFARTAFHAKFCGSPFKAAGDFDLSWGHRISVAAARIPPILPVHRCQSVTPAMSAVTA